MLNIVYVVFGAVFMVGMALFAFLKGGQAERFGAGAYLFAWFASIILQENSGFRGMPVGLFLIDVVALFVFVGLSWRYRRSWPVWVSGIQLITVMCHIMILTKQPVLLASLITVMNLNSYLIIGFMIVGTFFSWQDRHAAELNR
ncbi:MULTISPECIES: hypothetical protein [unclassified Brevundimonas]|uniref:hypothetical protein n=1 Tax=unclassified Brevundimonas TaxID=2622653 RepID=UPI000E90DEDF|nr:MULTISPECIES: hypothetical protein [unclassified Brevundimonas]MCK6104585.1 hypothetical protein [Brevundimonas sp. EYE_349]HBI20262.1 hypothetical protein [Brevundimonas sp.]